MPDYLDTNKSSNIDKRSFDSSLGRFVSTSPLIGLIDSVLSSNTLEDSPDILKHIPEGSYTIGRKDRRSQPRLDVAARRPDYLQHRIWLQHETISRDHAAIDVLKGELFMRDLGSSNGTFLDQGGMRMPFIEGYVEVNQIVYFGDCQCSIRELLESV